MTVKQLKEHLKDVDDEAYVLVYLPWLDDEEEADVNMSAVAHVGHVFCDPIEAEWQRGMARIGAEMPAVILRLT